MNNLKIQLYNEEGNLIYIGHINDNEIKKLTKDKKFDLNKSSNMIFLYLRGEKNEKR